MKIYKDYDNINVMDHALIKHKIGFLRRVDTDTKNFRQLIGEISMLICYEAMHDLTLKDVSIKTPICETVVKELEEEKIVIVPILRAGIGMAEGIFRIVPNARVEYIGMYRDPKTLSPVEYYCKLPKDCTEDEVFIVDPMLATGGSIKAAIKMLKDRGCRKINVLCIIAAPEGIEEVHNVYSDINIYVGCVDEKRNENAYIVPGLGDAGDRLFGTENVHG